MATEQEISEELKKRYPTYAYVIDAVPEIKGLLVQAKQMEDAGTPWDEAELMAKMQATNWWRSTGNQVKLWQELKLNSPGEADTQRREREAELWDLTRRTGVTISVEAVQALAEQSLSFGWNAQSPQLIDAIATMAHYNPGVGKETSTLGGQMAQLKARASDYYVPLTDEEAFNFSRRIMAGELDPETVDVHFQELARGRFNQDVVGAMERGITPKQFIAPRVQEAAGILEISAEEIDVMRDPKWSKIIDHVAEDGTRRAMTLSEVQRLAREDERFKATRQGQELGAQVAETLLTTFGKRAS